MRHSKQALLVFGAGAVLGLVVVSAELPGLARIASLTMAAGIVLLPFALFADWRSALPGMRKHKAKPKAKRRTPSRRRPKRQR